MLHDGARMLVYFMTQDAEIARLWPFLLVASIGAILGMLLGNKLLKQIPEPIYRRVVAILLMSLGVFMFFRVNPAPVLS